VVDAYADALSAIGIATLDGLTGMEVALRRLDPPELPGLRDELTPYHDALAIELSRFRATEPPPELATFHDRFLEGATAAGRAMALFLETPPPHEAITRVLSSMRTLCQALDVFYALHRLPPLSRYFVEPAYHDRIDQLDPEPPAGVSVGIHRTRGENADGAQRGGFCLYVPERYDGTADWPLVVALHGGSGTGDDFLWTWLREARGRRFLLLAPTAVGATWAMMGPDVDAPALRSMVSYVREHWRVDPNRILLTGLSDGATYTLLCGLGADTPFTALAPVSGVLHPAVMAGDRLAAATGRRIYLVHGARDWLFPVAMARVARDVLTQAGADLTYREIEDLSHTYPREENDRILTWFDPSLALPYA
jgi:phospholipase/carboxylesterase